MTFHEWINDAQRIVEIALQARKEYGICKRSRFGDCNDTSNGTIALLAAAGIKAKLVIGVDKVE